MWQKVVVGCLLAAACGGRSERDGASTQASGNGGADIASGSGGTVPGAAGVAGSGGGGSGGDGGTHPVWTETPETGDSPECLAYKVETDVLTACNLIIGCPATLREFLESFNSELWFDISFARAGCGLTEILQPGGVGGLAFVFDAEGMLVGYNLYSDTPYGLCESFNYQRGVHLGECAEFRECALSPDAATAEPGETICRCACPDPPPSDGVAEVELACADRPSRGWTCGENLARWGDLGSRADLSGTIRTGCGATVVRLVEREGALDCVYDEAELFAGSMWTSIQTGCPGVTAWRGGLPYVSCPDETECTFGSGEPASPAPHCASYPYQ